MARMWRPRWISYAVSYIILYQIQAFSLVDRLVYGEWWGKPGDKLTQLLFLSQILVAAALIYNGRRAWPSLRSSVAVWLGLALYLFATAIWSVEPGATIRAGLQYLTLIAVAVGVVLSLEVDEFMDLLLKSCFACAVISIFLYFVSPASVFGSTGDFRGVFSQKNQLGEAMSMGALGCVHSYLTQPRRRALRILMFIPIFFATLLSASTTSLLTIIMFGCLGAVIYKHGKKLLLIVLPIALAVIPARDMVFELLGKDPTLTGRTELWGYVVPEIWKSPILGWGYAAFWNPLNPPAVKISTILGWPVPQAHNGVLEILLSAGLVGGVVYLYLLIRYFSLSISCLRLATPAIGVTGFLACAGVVVTGVGENVLIYGNAITSIFLTTALFVDRAVWKARRNSLTMKSRSIVTNRTRPSSQPGFRWTAGTT